MSNTDVDAFLAELREFKDEVRRALVAIAAHQSVGIVDGKIVTTVGYASRPWNCDDSPYKHHMTRPDGTCICGGGAGIST